MFQVLAEEVNKIKKHRDHPTQTLLPVRQEPWTAEDLTALTDSIRKHGQIEPLVVVQQPDETLVVADGNRRLRVFAGLGITSVSIVVAEGFDELLSLLPTFWQKDGAARVPYSKRILQFAGLYRNLISPLGERERRKLQSALQKGRPKGSGAHPGGGYIPRVTAHFGFSKSRLSSMSMAVGLLEEVPISRRSKAIEDIVDDVNQGRVQEDQIYERFASLGGAVHAKAMSQVKVTDDTLVRSLNIMTVLNKFLAEMVFGDLDEVTPEVKAKTLRSLADLRRSATIATKILKKE
mgnify:FL=1